MLPPRSGETTSSISGPDCPNKRRGASVRLGWRPHNMTIPAFRRLAVLFPFSLMLIGCGSSEGRMPNPPLPPQPALEARLAEWAANDPNNCRARTPGFEALGGWLKADGREPGESRIWVLDVGALDQPRSHGVEVWGTLTGCAVREVPENRHFTDDLELEAAYRADGRDAIRSESLVVLFEDISFPDPEPLSARFPEMDGAREGQRILYITSAGNDSGRRTGELQRPAFQGALAAAETALWLTIGGYTGTGENREPASGSSVCGAADALCLFAPWEGEGAGHAGTSHSTPRVSAALDAVWAVWPEMDVLDLRNLAFDCAENRPARTGDRSTERTYSYSNGREFTSTTNSTWGHGILSLTCLFTPNGGLQNPITGAAISGGIHGPLTGPVVDASVTGVDYTGRDFGHPFARPVARENHALLASASLRAASTVFGTDAGHAPDAFHGSLWRSGAFRVDLTTAGDAVGAAVGWRNGNLTVRGGLAIQPEGVGSLTGSRAFRAPSTVSAAITAAYGQTLRAGFSAHIEANHWRTVATQGRSLWEGAAVRESRLVAALVKRAGAHEFALEGVWQSGLSGSLDVDGRNWRLAPEAARSVWLTWRRTG